MKKIITTACCVLLLIVQSTAQDVSKKHNFLPVMVGFYNLENLYDTTNNPAVDDEEFLPQSQRHYNTQVYFDKLGRLASVIAQMGTDVTPDGMALLGVAEIENDTVLTDLVNEKIIKDRKYRFEHYDSPDKRGVDVGLLYNPKYFKVISSAPLFVKLPGGSKESFLTRDVLYVKGELLGDTVHVFVNHWPSRSGGEERSIPARAAAARVCKIKVDSLIAIDTHTKIIIMGDLNDDPTSPSVAQVLNAKGTQTDVADGGLYNPWVSFYKNGIGTLAYQDAWGLFDQIIISKSWLDKTQPGLFYYRANIFNKEFMVQKTGKFRGYAKRTWDGTTYNYGYSDHFPTYISLLKRKD